MIHHPAFEMYDVMAATLPDLEFVPSFHVHYGETVLPMADGLVKFFDFPADLGGSGKIVEE